MNIRQALMPFMGIASAILAATGCALLVLWAIDPEGIRGSVAELIVGLAAVAAAVLLNILRRRMRADVVEATEVGSS